MKGMFYGVKNFNEDISNWDVSKVTNMKEMFCVATIMLAMNQRVFGTYPSWSYPQVPWGVCP